VLVDRREDTAEKIDFPNTKVFEIIDNDICVVLTHFVTKIRGGNPLIKAKAAFLITPHRGTELNEGRITHFLL